MFSSEVNKILAKLEDCEERGWDELADAYLMQLREMVDVKIRRRRVDLRIAACCLTERTGFEPDLIQPADKKPDPFWKEGDDWDPCGEEE